MIIIVKGKLKQNYKDLDVLLIDDIYFFSGKKIIKVVIGKYRNKISIDFMVYILTFLF